MSGVDGTMRKLRVLALGVLATVAWQATARAQLDVVPARITNEPAATLLLPYFEVAFPKKIGGKGAGIDTVFSINNASRFAVLTHVTIWSDLAVPVTAFNVYLTGYDLQEIDLRDVLNGHVPRTASAGQDVNDTLSPHGPLSQDINYASCGGQLPYPDPLPVETIEHIRAALTGKMSPLLGKCLGRDLGEKKPIARGYVTVDTVSSCTLRLPTDPSYFVSDTSIQNVLWGDYAIIDKSKKVARGDAMVAIKASSPGTGAYAIGDYTFYGGLDGFTATDARQPLATTFAGRFVNVPKHPIFPSGTSVIAWRDPKHGESPFPCGTTPPPFPLDQAQIVVFDEQENPEIPVLPPIPPFPSSSIKPFPAATQIVKIGGPAFPVSTTAGWIYVNLSNPVAGAGPSGDPTLDQGWVIMVLENKGKYSAAARAIALDSATRANSAP